MAEKVIKRRAMRPPSGLNPESAEKAPRLSGARDARHLLALNGMC
jgi:hypothetical protein